MKAQISHWRMVIFTCVLIAGLIWIRQDRGESAIAPTTRPTDTPAYSLVPAPPDSTATVTRGTLWLSYDFDAVFEPVNAFAVKIKTRHYHDDFVIKSAVAPNSKVTKGDVLMTLESDKIDSQIAGARNDLTIAEANLRQAVSDVQLGEQADELAMNAAQDVLSDAQTNVKRWQANEGAIFLLAGELPANVADFEADNAADELDQLKKMYKSEDLTNQTADIVMKRAVRELELDKIQARVTHSKVDRTTQIQAAVNERELNRAVKNQEMAISQLQAAQTHSASLRRTALASAQIARDTAARNLQDLLDDKESFNIVSPIDGEVVYGGFSHKAWQQIEPERLAAGETVQPDQVLITVYVPGQLRVRGECPEGQVGLMIGGTKVTVTPVAMPQSNYAGTCEAPMRVGENKGNGQTFDVVIDVPSLDVTSQPGFKANVNLDAGYRSDVLLIPASAVWHGKVWLSKPGGAAGKPAQVEICPIEVGASDGRQVEVRSGLSEGDVVLLQARRPVSE